jgi:hypothetical protein
VKLTDEHFDQAGQLANEIIDFAFDEDNDSMSALACLMAATPYLLDVGCSTGEACRLLKILMNSYKDSHGTEKH